MYMIESEKYINLIEYLKKFPSVAVAFSGGVDSTFLLKAAKEALGQNVIAINVITPYVPSWEVIEAKETALEFGVNLEIIEAGILDSIKNNPEDRCYHCKKFLFQSIINRAKILGINNVADGTNIDDTKEYRPGIKALKELNVVSPLKENNLTKAEIREFSRVLGISGWNKPACACFLSRIPYNTEITIEEINKIGSSEEYLRKLGFQGARVRSHKDIARIELNGKDVEKLFDSEMRKNIVKTIKDLGFTYVTMDLEGYKTGSLNVSIGALEKRL